MCEYTKLQRFIKNNRDSCIFLPHFGHLYLPIFSLAKFFLSVDYIHYEPSGLDIQDKMEEFLNKKYRFQEYNR